MPNNHVSVPVISNRFDFREDEVVLSCLEVISEELKSLLQCVEVLSTDIEDLDHDASHDEDYQTLKRGIRNIFEKNKVLRDLLSRNQNAANVISHFLQYSTLSEVF